jgi:anaerobic selenocysteine-containing dehydrogenase
MPQPTISTHKSFCRICSAFCALEVDVVEGRVRRVRGDASDPIHGGYTCSKGRQVPHQMNGPERLRSAYRRRADGGFDAIATEMAIGEIAERVNAIVARDGARAVAAYMGTASHFNSATNAVVKAWLAAIGSPGYYTSLTIDQPAKIVSVVRHGLWAGGGHSFASADVVLSIGNNPIVSHLSLPGGVPGNNPVKRLNDEQQRGLKIIVADPRRSELAKRADLHLQVRPGEDPTLLAGMVRAILAEELHDAAFCAEYVTGLEALRQAVDGFTPDYVERRTGVAADRMLEAARLFARGPRGMATSGTGPDMAPRPNLTEHLIISLNTLCGRWNREGDPIANPGVLSPALPRPAQAIPRELMPPMLRIGGGPRSRVRSLQQVFGEMPTPALADEILLPGAGQVKALFTIGGNPVAAWPDQRKTLRALDALELHVCVETEWTVSAQHADYVIPAKLPLEREDVTFFADPFYERPYSMYSEAIVEPDFDAIEDWELFTGIARRMGKPLELPDGKGPIDAASPPSKFALMEQITAGSRVPLAEIRSQPGGHVFDEIDVRASAPIPGVEAKLDVAPEAIPEELREVRSEPVLALGQYGDDGSYTHLLISRRLRHVVNSVGQGWPQSRRKGTTNPAFMSHEDFEALGLKPGEVVAIESEHDRILGVVEPSHDLRPGVISMSHAWGEAPERDGEVRDIGANTGRLISTERHYDSITGMARQSAIPVRVKRLE